MWDLPRSGIEPVSHALAGRFFTAQPPEKPHEAYVSFWESFLDKCPGVGLLDHTVVLFSIFKGISILFSTVAVPIYIPTGSVGGLPSLHTSPAFVCGFSMTVVILTSVSWWWKMSVWAITCWCPQCLNVKSEGPCGPSDQLCGYWLRTGRSKQPREAVLVTHIYHLCQNAVTCLVEICRYGCWVSKAVWMCLWADLAKPSYCREMKNVFRV